jgi:hypothetical protein
MKREVEREKKLPAFSLTLGELETLWGRLQGLFEGQNIYTSLTITFAKEKLEFKNVEELKQYNDLKGRITDFSLLLSNYLGRRLSIRSGGLFYGRAEVSATAENEAWCAGAVETASSFVQSHKVWFSWFTSPIVGWVLLVVVDG